MVVFICYLNNNFKLMVFNILFLKKKQGLINFKKFLNKVKKAYERYRANMYSKEEFKKEKNIA